MIKAFARNILIILIIIGVIITSGCTKYDEIPSGFMSDMYTSNSKLSPQVSSTSNQKDTNDAKEEIVDNEFFFNRNISQINYKGEFLFDDIIEQDVKLNINEKANLKNGKLYELKLELTEGVPDDRLSLGYFYVQKDKIYKIYMTEENLIELKASEELPDGSVIVCQDNEIKDTLGEDEQGFHYFLEVDGDKREYHSYNNQVDTGYYESFTWEKGKGLINYQSGFGAERDSIDIQLIN